MFKTYIKSIVFILFLISCNNNKIKNDKDTPNSNGIELSLKASCNYYGENNKTEKLYGFNSDINAQKAIEKIMQYTGLSSNFKILAANVPNACAVIECNNINGDCDRFILYNQEFMLRVKEVTNNDWSAISILAHEVGHHLSGHTLETSGSRPSIELQADKFSGFVLAKMGATLDDAIIAIKNIGSESPSLTHPIKSARIAAITNGWVEGGGSNNVNTNNPLKDISEIKLSPIPTSSNQNTESENSNPEYFVRSFIEDLGNQDYVNAFNKSKNKFWPNYRWFSSTKAFGGIAQTQIFNSSIEVNNENYAEIYIDYYASDPYNQNGEFKQIFYLKKINGTWKIIKTKSLDVSFY